jgi:uncharacterized protein
MKSRAITHIDIPTADRPATARFYSQLLGWNVGSTEVSVEYTHFNAPNFTGGFPNLAAGFKPVTQVLRAGEVMLYVQSENLEQDVAEAEALGGTVALARTKIPGACWIAIVRAPNGAPLAMISEQAPAA